MAVDEDWDLEEEFSQLYEKILILHDVELASQYKKILGILSFEPEKKRTYFSNMNFSPFCTHEVNKNKGYFTI